MKVITRNRIVVNPDVAYSYVDGNSPSEEVLATQKIINRIITEKELESGGAPTGFQRPLENGIWDSVTEMWYTSNKERVDAELNRLKNFLSKVVSQSSKTSNKNTTKKPMTDTERALFLKLQAQKAVAQNAKTYAENAKREAEKAKLEAEASKVNSIPTEKQTWWKSRTKTQKGLIIGGGVLAVGLTIFLIVRAQKKRQTA